MPMNEELRPYPYSVKALEEKVRRLNKLVEDLQELLAKVDALPEMPDGEAVCVYMDHEELLIW